MKNIFKSKRKALLSIIAIVMVSFVLVNICASAFFSFAIFKKDGWKSFEKYSYGKEPESSSEWISEKSVEIQLENSEKKNLTALEIKNEHISHSYIIICHQYGASPYSMEEYAKHFYELGFNIILPVLRGHGESPYENISMGWKDYSDIVDWVNNIIEKDENAKIALLGVSLGANAVTLAAAEDLPENVRLVISDSCYVSFEDLLKEYIKKETPFSSLFVTELTCVFSESKVGVSLKDSDIIKDVRNIELPIMFINGENDSVVPPLISKRLYENCEAEGVEEVIIENGTHGRNLQADKEAYLANIDAFILNNIGI